MTKSFCGNGGSKPPPYNNNDLFDKPKFEAFCNRLENFKSEFGGVLSFLVSLPL